MLLLLFNEPEAIVTPPAVQGGLGCATWGSGPVWGDGHIWCSDVGTPFEFVTEKEVRAHRLAVRVNYTFDARPGSPEAFRIYQVRARWTPSSQLSFPFGAVVDGVQNSERIAARLNYTAVPGIADQTLNAHHGAVIGTPTFQAPPAIGTGHGMTFTEAVPASYCTIPHVASYNTPPFSVEFWALLRSTATNPWSTPIVHSSNDQWDDGWGFYDRATTGNFTWWVNQYDGAPVPTIDQIYVRVPRPSTDVYHHYVGTFDGVTAKLYIDTVLVGSTTKSGAGFRPTSAAPRVGYGMFERSTWEGSLDELATYNVELTPYQIQAHYDAVRQDYRRAIAEDAPVGHWALEEEGAYGSALNLYRTQITAQRKQHQPKG